MQIIKSKYLFDGIQILENKAIVLDSKKIVDVLNIDQIPNDSNVIDYGDKLITQGFIDLQINGIGGVVFNNDISLDALEIMHQTNLLFGTVGFLPTIITCDFKDIVQALNVVKDWFAKYQNTRGVLGIHIEGPFISMQKPGIHPQKYILKPEMQHLAKIVEFRKYFPIKLTIAPEEFESEQIEYLIKNDIILAIGHSNANYSVIETAINLGVSALTHTFNAMSGLTARNPGVIGAALNLPLYTGLIADLIHVDMANIKLLYSLKKDMIYLVSDSVTPTGTDIQEFEFAQHKLKVVDKKIVDEMGTLGGAYLTLNEAIKNCVKIGIPLTDVLKMAVVTPLKVMNLNIKNGMVTKGSLNNLVALDLNEFECGLI